MLTWQERPPEGTTTLNIRLAHPVKPSSTLKRLDYDRRVFYGHRFERELAAYLSSFNIDTAPFGQDLLLPNFKAKLRLLEDSTSKLIRYTPDLIALLPDQKGSFLIEAKSAITTTGFYSINVDSYTLQRKLVSDFNPPNTLRILYIFPAIELGEDYRAEWVQDLHRAISKKIIDPEKLKAAEGSQRPFALVSKDKLKPLTEVLKELTKVKELHGAVKPFDGNEYRNALYGRVP